MKRVFIAAFAISVLASCGNNNSSTTDEKKGSETTVTPVENDLSSNPDYQKGLAIEAANDCATCHKVDEKLTGPSFKEIATKYAGMPDTIVTHLAHKIIHGGSGVWGEVIMTPHPQISLDSAEAVVKYILLLK